MFFDQSDNDVRFEWGLAGVQALAPISDVMIIVDVLSFATSVDVAVANGALIYPYAGPREELPAYAAKQQAQFAMPGRKQAAGYSLSPASLTQIPAGTRLVLPSPNGSTLSLACGEAVTFCGCLRNAAAIGAQAAALGRTIGVVAGGERWPDGSLRPALEDLLGAGAIIEGLDGSRSPEAEMAVAAWRGAAPTLEATLQTCGSARELIERGFAADVWLAAQVNRSHVAPQLIDGAFQQSASIRRRSL
jgi:2-phosphosulfolactate phosphatase